MEKYKFLFKIFNQIYTFFSDGVICCSSLPFKLYETADRFNILQQSINLAALNNEFTGTMAHHLFMVWLKLITKNVIFLHQLEKETKEKHL